MAQRHQSPQSLRIIHSNMGLQSHFAIFDIPILGVHQLLKFTNDVTGKKWEHYLLPALQQQTMLQVNLTTAQPLTNLQQTVNHDR